MQRCLTLDFLLAVCKYTCRLATLGGFFCFFQKAAWEDLTKQQHSWETLTSIRFVSQLWGKFWGIFFVCCIFRLKSSSLQCLPLSGTPRSWDAGLCITPGKQKQRRYVPSGNIKPYVSCKLPAGILLCVWLAFFNTLKNDLLLFMISHKNPWILCILVIKYRGEDPFKSLYALFYIFFCKINSCTSGMICVKGALQWTCCCAALFLLVQH